MKVNGVSTLVFFDVLRPHNISVKRVDNGEDGGNPSPGAEGVMVGPDRHHFLFPNRVAGVSGGSVGLVWGPLGGHAIAMATAISLVHHHSPIVWGSNQVWWRCGVRVRWSIYQTHG